MSNNVIPFNNPNAPKTMSSMEIAELTEKRHDNVVRTIKTLVGKSVIREPQIEVFEEINNLGFTVGRDRYIFSGEQGKRDSIVVVAQLSPEFTGRLVDRWMELEEKVAALPPATIEEIVQVQAAILVDHRRILDHHDQRIATLENKFSNMENARALPAPTQSPKKIVLCNGKSYTMTQAARELGVGRDEFIRFLNREMKWIDRAMKKDPWAPTRHALNDFYMVARDMAKYGLQARITPHGLAYLREEMIIAW